MTVMMKSILYVTSSIFGDQGKSSCLSQELVDKLCKQNPGAEIIRRHLEPESIPYLDANSFTAFISAADSRTAEQEKVIEFSDELINEWRASDCVVIGLPMYNLNVPSSFKSYIDHIARVGQTFKYTENGPVGLLADRQVYVVTARGGRYLGTPRDTQTPYVQHMLGLLGIASIKFFHAEGLNMGEEPARQAIAEVRRQIADELKLLQA